MQTKEEKAAYWKAYQQAHKEQKRALSRKSQLKNKYGLTLEQYGDMLEAQDNRCALCHKPFTYTPHVDHDHKTGRVRGLLHSKCNRGLHFIEDAEYMQQAKAYLR